MPSQEKTKHLGLNQWQGNEYVKRQDFVDDNQIIDSAVETITEEVEAIQSDIYSPQYSDQKTTVAPVISMENTVDGKLKYTLKGRTLTNLVKNGNFKDGITRWAAFSSNIATNNSTLINSCNGTARSGTLLQNVGQVIDGKTYFLRAKVRVTNNDCTALLLHFRSAISGAMTAMEINTPILNRWYNMYGKVIISSSIITGDILRVGVVHYYVDDATANEKVMEVQEVIALDLEQYPDLQSLTAEEINAQIPGYIDGMQSVENVKMVSVGKNLFDEKLELGTLGSAGNNETSLTNCRSNFILIAPGSNVKYSIGAEYVLSAYRLYNANKRFVVSSGAELVVPQNVYYARVVLRRRDGANISPEDIANMQNSFMLEYSDTPTPYEEYKESTNFLPLPLQQLPNGVADTIDSEGNYIRRIGEYTLKSEDIQGIYRDYTNLDYTAFSTDVLVGIKNKGLNDIEGTIAATNITTPRRGIPNNSVDLYWKHAISTAGTGTFIIYFPKDTYANTGEIRAALAGTKVIYELETPVVSKINIPPVTSFKDGTLMFQNRRKYVLRAEDIEGMYTTYANVDIAFLNKSKLIDYIAIGQLSTGTIDVNGWLETGGGANIQLVQNIGKYSTSGNVGSVLFIFPKGTTLAQAREQLAGLEIEYETIPYPLPQIEYTYPLNLAAGQQGNTEMIAQLNSVFQDLGEGGEYGTATSAEVMEGYTLGTEKGVIDGKMLNIGAVTNTITTQGGQYTIPQGYHRGSGKVTASFPNLIPENVKEGINIGGILGSAKTYSIDFQCNKKEIGSGDYELGRFILPSSWKFLYLEASADQGSNFVIINKSLFHSNYEKREGSYDGILVLSDVSVSDNNVLDFRIYNKHKNSQLVNYRCYAVI